MNCKPVNRDLKQVQL